MRHGPELHDALRKSQSNKPSGVAGAANRSSTGDVPKSTLRHSQPARVPESGGSLQGGYPMNNGTAVTAVESARESVTTEPQQPHGVGMKLQHGVISDSGYWSPKNYNSSDYHVPTTKPTELQRNVSNARPVMPPPAPPPPTSDSVADRDSLVQNSGLSTARQPARVSTTPSGRMMANRDSLPPPPPAPSAAMQPQQTTVSDYSLQTEPLPPAPNEEYELPPPPMPPSFDDMPAAPSPLPDYSASYPAQDDMAESPLPLPPDDVNFDVMVVPPPPPPLVEYEQTTSNLDGAFGSGLEGSLDRLQPDDNLDRFHPSSASLQADSLSVQPDSASLSSEASSLAAKSVTDDVAEPPVRDQRSDLLVAIRKGQCDVFHYYVQTTLRVNSDDNVTVIYNVPPGVTTRTLGDFIVRLNLSFKLKIFPKT